MRTNNLRTALLAATAITCGWAGTAFAQDGANVAGVLEEVVVTATRQADTVNRVPLSITAQTQRTLDQQGVKNVSDLARITPALTVTNGQAGVATFAIRGIVATTGAATTGLYQDDTALQKRNVTCANATACGNGTPGPLLFDLERVEVLRGPQGTLYGGSSQGGTIRFITPQPSLTRYSGYVRGEYSHTQYGGSNYEGGVAVGGPIVQDKLGFRVSVFDRKTSGYIDYLDPYNNGALRIENANSSRERAVRAQLAWAPTDRSRITLAYYESSNNTKDINSSYDLPLAGTVTTTNQCFNATTGNPPPAVPCAPGVRYNRAAVTYGPFPYLDKPFNYINNPFTSPSISLLSIASVTFDYNFDNMSAKLVSSYIEDQTKNRTWERAQAANQQRTTLYPFANGFELYQPFKDYPGAFNGTNKRRGISEELRFASIGDHPFTWVAGAFYSNQIGHSYYSLPMDLDRIAQGLFGINSTQRYGVPPLNPTDISHRDQNLKENELAAFGEGTYRFTDKFRVIGGVRASRVQFSYNQVFYGQLSGFNDPFALNAVGAQQGVVSGTVQESPITPRAGLQYNFTPDDMLYVNAAKGFRAGGVNSPLSPGLCGPGLAAAGLTVADIPKTFGSDRVWSYEAGAKLRLLNNRLQLNSSIYRIDWQGVQLAVGVAGCAQTWVQNAGTARSEGFDVQAQGRVFPGLTASLSVSYNKARYTQSAAGPKPIGGAAATPVVQKGDRLPVSPWTVTLGAQYDFPISGDTNAYIRGDYQFTGKYLRGLGFGVTAFQPDTINAESTQYVTARAGVLLGRWDVNVFVNNLFNSRDALSRAGGRTGCSLAGTAACDGTPALAGAAALATPFTNYNPLITEGTFRPRTIGAQASYRF